MNTQRAEVLVKSSTSLFKGEIKIWHGELAGLDAVSGEGRMEDNRFEMKSEGGAVLGIIVGSAMVATGGCATRVGVFSNHGNFTFFLRDISVEFPMWIPRAKCVVSAVTDKRSYLATIDEISRRGGRNYLQRLSAEPEECFRNASRITRSQKNETWLGLSRDMQIFHFDTCRSNGYDDGCWGMVKPFKACYAMPVSTSTFKGYRISEIAQYKSGWLQYTFFVGRGASCSVEISRHLEDGHLPILTGKQVDGSVTYHITAFASFGDRPLTPESLSGTHCLVADGHSACHVFTEDQERLFKEQNRLWEEGRQEVFLYIRINAVNSDKVPRYAWFKAPMLSGSPQGDYTTDGLCVLRIDNQEKVFAVNRINGKPMREKEQAILLPPGGEAEYDILIPHSPFPKNKTFDPGKMDFTVRHRECHKFWKGRYSRNAVMEVPERRVNEMIKAGFLHLDLIAYGQEPDGALAPTIGKYAPLATEVVPIVGYFNFIGRSDLARRALEFFLSKQHKDGKMRNYAAVMTETGPVLYMIGEHCRLTHDLGWQKAITPRVLKACEHIISERCKNSREECRGVNYGMIAGTLGDNETGFSYFMTNGYAYAGLRRTAEWLRDTEPEQAGRLAMEAEEYRRDIRKALIDNMDRSPVVPLADGTWRSSVSPMAENAGNYHLFCDGKACFSHSAFQSEDVIAGPLWLVFQEVFDPDEPVITDILHYQTELFMRHNSALSMPYYGRHDYIHLRRGETEAFLKTYYINMASMFDRETYTCCEHSSGHGPHKAHEEAWFLMQTRWMLLLEEGKNLSLLKGMPRAWMANGQAVRLANMPTYFGEVCLDVESHVDRGFISAEFFITGGPPPERIFLRLPHPDGRLPCRIEGGEAIPNSENIELVPVTGKRKIVLKYS